MNPCALLVVDTHEKKPRAKIRRRNFKKQKTRKTQKRTTKTHTRLSCCCCGEEEGGIIKTNHVLCRLFLYIPPRVGDRWKRGWIVLVLPRRRFDGLIQLLEFAERRLTGLTRSSEIRLARRRHLKIIIIPNALCYLARLKEKEKTTTGGITFSFGLDGRRAECVAAAALDHVSRTWDERK